MNTADAATAVESRRLPESGPIADLMLARSADATYVLDVESGLALRRWHDPSTSRLPYTPEAGVDRLVTWIHPDDLPALLEAYAGVVHGRETRSATARMHPDHDPSDSVTLKITISDVRDAVPGGVLVQVWVVEFDRALESRLDPKSSFSSLAAAAPVGLQVRSALGLVTFENERFTALAGTAHEIVDELIARAVSRRVEAVEDVHVGEVALRVRVVPSCDDEGRLVLAVASLEDISMLEAAVAGRAEAENLFRAVFHGSPLATAMVSLDGSLVQVNESFAVITGYSIEQLEQVRFQDITHPDDLAADEELLAELLEETRSSYQMEKRYIHRAGHDIWVDLTVAPVYRPDGTIGHLIAHVEDITSRHSVLDSVQSSDDLAYWATHDHLTGLPNRRHLDSYLDRCFGKMRRADDTLAVLFLDLDDFKPVNDTLGHQVGDEVLRTIARRLRNSCRDEAVVARYGGDEFVVVSRRLRSAADVPVLVERIMSSVCTPIEGPHDPIQIGASIGIGIAREGDDADSLIQRADRAAYRAKANGKNRVSYL